MTPLERAARAVADVWWDSHHFGNTVPRYNWDRLHPAQRRASFATVRAVLMAVREPTGEMTYAATHDEFHEASAQDKAGENWIAMIDAILADQPKGG